MLTGEEVRRDLGGGETTGRDGPFRRGGVGNKQILLASYAVNDIDRLCLIVDIVLSNYAIKSTNFLRPA